MKFSKILISAALLGSALCGFAQEEVTEYTYRPNWYVQGQFGSQYTLGELKAGKLFSPNAQIAVGYHFNPYVGARLAVNAWQSRAGSDINGSMYSHLYRWKWNYVAPTLDVTVDLTNVFGGYRPNRLCDVNAFLGFGANIGFNNHEAHDVQTQYFQATGQPLLGDLLWDGTKARFLTQFGADLNFNISQNFSIGLEIMANVLPDGYNSKKAGNADWYFNGLVGFRYTFGKKYNKTTRVVEAPAPQVIERIVEKVVEVPAPVVEQKVTNDVVEVKQLRRDIFFKISNTSVAKDQMAKVTEVAKFLKENPDATVVITGYADKGTGSRALNLRLAAKRAKTVADCLANDYNIARSRMTVKSMGEDEYQPYDDPVDNRVAICICQ